MADIKRIAMAGGAVVTAAAIGFVMQSGDDAEALYAATNTMPDISGTADAPLEVTDITLTAAVAAPAETRDVPQGTSLASADRSMRPSRPQGIQLAALGSEVGQAEVDAALEQAEQSLCDVTMTATPVAAAMVNVTLDASCYPNERVTLHHNGMMFTTATDETGHLNVSVPALSTNAVFISAFANGEGGLASATVDSLEFYDRKVIQSKKTAHLHIDAFEFGANYRDEGHVNISSDRDIEHAAMGEGGFVTSLGNTDVADALVAEIYTFPSATVKDDGDILVSVEAEISIDNCGLQLEAQTLEVAGAGDLKVQDLTLPFPACDAVGDFVVLQNLLSDLTIARN